MHERCCPIDRSMASTTIRVKGVMGGPFSLSALLPARGPAIIEEACTRDANGGRPGGSIGEDS